MSDDNQGSGSILGGPRIGPLANLPVFFKLNGKRVVLVGGGEPALWKAELLAATGALVEVFAETFTDGFYELSSAPSKGQILLVNRRWSTNDLDHAALAVGAFADENEAAAFASAAHEAGVPVNVVDRPALCDFQFGAIVNRSPLVIGISTDGAAPVFGQAIRSLIESFLPENFAAWAAAARDLRLRGARFGDTPNKKRRFWQRFTDLALSHAERTPTDADFGQLIAEDKVTRLQESVAIIDICENVDALTLGAIRLLRVADDIFVDEGIPAAVTDFARREARRHRIAGGQADTRWVGPALAKAAAEGSRVVRLRLRVGAYRAGDVEDADALRAAGISVVVLTPGPTP